MTNKQFMNSCIDCIDKYVSNGFLNNRSGIINFVLGYYSDKNSIPKFLIETVMNKYSYLDY